MHNGPDTDGLTPREGEVVLSRVHPLTRAQVEALGPARDATVDGRRVVVVTKHRHSRRRDEGRED